jgi:6-phosphogluconate dehydrogenase
MADTNTFKRIGIVGAGSMGSMMALAFLELGFDVSIWDISKENVDHVLEMTNELDSQEKKGTIDAFHDVHEFLSSLNDSERRLFLFSITHGDPTDSVIEKIGDDFREGDIVLDGGNENYRRTEHRQKQMEKRGVSWIGMGVSGGYQSARRGPSLSPGGSKAAFDAVRPILEKYAVKDSKTKRPCVTYVGPRGSGHFVKMVHNGIENGMLSTLAEAWSILHKSLDMRYDEISEVFKAWNAKGELRNTFLVKIAADICETKHHTEGEGGLDQRERSSYVLDEVLDKVVQDVDDTEGTLYWTVMEAAARHIAAPTIATGHFLRVASANRRQRLDVAEKLHMPTPQLIQADRANRDAFVEKLRCAVFTAFLCSFCQGLELIARASKDESWNVSLAECLKIWRAGCIIQEEYIADMLEPVFRSAENEGINIMNIKLVDEVSTALHEHYPALKEVVLRSVELDNYVPSLSASLEYLKYTGGEMLPTQFMEAQLDYFGAHRYDRPNVEGEDPGKPKKGKQHYEWKAP